MLQMLFAFLVIVLQTSRSYTWMAVEGFMKDEFAVRIPDQIVALAKARVTFSNFGKAIRTLFRTAIAAYNVWFWFQGTSILDNTDSCAAEIFLFARVALQNSKLRRFYRTTAITYLYFTGDDFIILLGKALIRVLRIEIEKSFKSLSEAATSSEGQTKVQKHVWTKLRSIYVHMNEPSRGRGHLDGQEEDGSLINMHANHIHRYSRRIGYIRTTMTLCELIAIAWSIATIELSLLWTNINGVNGISSAGQIIPAIIGITSLLKTVNSIILKRARKAKQVARQRKSGGVLDQESAIWQFGLRDGRIARFFASSPPGRRWSLDPNSFEISDASRKPPQATIFKDSISSPVPTARLRTERPFELYDEQESGDNIHVYYSSNESLASDNLFVEKGTPKDGKNMSSPWPYTRVVDINKRSGKFLQHRRTLKFRHGEWWYRNTRKDGRIQVFGDFPVETERGSLDIVTTRELPSLPRVIDPPSTSSKTSQGKLERPRPKSERDDWTAAVTGYRRRERSPCHFTSGGRWHYDLKDGRKQVFAGNPTIIRKPGHRRASFDDARLYIADPQPYTYQLADELAARAYERTPEPDLETFQSWGRQGLRSKSRTRSIAETVGFVAAVLLFPTVNIVLAISPSITAGKEDQGEEVQKLQHAG